MSGTTAIQWTEKTWNPVSGCTRVSAGCDHCYAVRLSHRLESMGQAARYGGLTVLNNRGDRHFNGVVRTHEDVLTAPLGWRKPRMVFVNSMSDLFHEGVPFEFIDRVFAVMALCPHHTFQILTKRPERMAEYLTKPTGFQHERTRRQLIDYTAQNRLPVEVITGRWYSSLWPLPNVWLGTSCEDQDTWYERVPWLRSCPAAVRFVSCEPLLGEIPDTELAHGCRGCNHPGNIMPVWNSMGRCSTCDGLGQEPSEIHWVIVGGESGPNARRMDPEWARLIRDQCAEANGVAFFMKQMGGRSSHKGAMEDLPEDLRIREFPAAGCTTEHTEHTEGVVGVRQPERASHQSSRSVVSVPSVVNSSEGGGA